MKFALSSDTHLMLDKPVARLDDAHETQKKKVREIIEWCFENDAIWLVAGDFLHQSRSWYLLSSWLDFFKNTWCDSRDDPRIYTVFGQHDTYLYSRTTSRATALGVLSSAGIVNTFTSEPFRFVDIHGPVHIYGCNHGEDTPVIEKGNSLNILVIHRMIVDVKLWAKQEKCDYAPAFLNTYKDFDLILCGDCHRKFIFKSLDGKRTICNSGPLLRYEANKYNLDHRPGFYTYDTDTQKIGWKELSHLPASEVLSREHIEEKEETNEMLARFIKGVKETNPDLEGEKGRDFRKNLIRFFKENKIEDAVKDVLADVMKDQAVK